MKKLVYFVIFAATVLFHQTAVAQETAWVQIEAHPSLQQGQIRARAYASAFEDVNGFALRSGWYAVVIGPFTEEGANQRLQELVRENLIPRDSYIADGSNFRQQYWPIGANTRTAEPIVIEDQTAAAEETTETVSVQLPDETPREARRSEAALSREERQLLQTALKSEGFYNSAIDGAFGRGTRTAMETYQTAMGYDPTGILTTLQRERLITDYNSILEGVGLRYLSNREAGIEIEMPTALVEFSRFEPPFVHYDATTDLGVKVLLISQAGTQATLFGLYDIMQTLEIVPPTGTRERNNRNFELTGQNDQISSYTYAALDDGLIKGFTLVWPSGDERRMRRVISEMRKSFTPFGTDALDETLGEPSEDQRIDLLAGLEIRQPDMSRSGFFIDGAGTVITTAEVVEECREITLNRDHVAEVAFKDTELGFAVLRPTESLAPIAFASFRQGVARIQSEVAVAGFPFEGVLDAPTLTFGQLADIRGLKGEDTLQRLALAPQAGDAGGPVFDTAGAVMGMLLPRPTSSGQQLPQDVSFSANARSIGAALEANGIVASTAESNGQIAAEDLTSRAADITVLVSCWN
ncbi:serine protease [Pseudohalocynthiibacter aestuariivivens]|jgi:S1-C subfamily serine protease|uniref:Serine protease n=1 Tax=Pseudohalocynthiibacter aestuariivivens TaxID=1591409 RepID=A0ABV5JC88_9RHOB|nr:MULTISPECIES: serine protease [Pseudohalocynthiibacter]MBS9718882.1 trypsin-like peptidase domain-containing protein [Pseudohalocynthiibacter aestuariivivens]MCK0101859.1 serine protease [Pseudohalocynthiibacter sp. F2068]